MSLQILQYQQEVTLPIKVLQTLVYAKHDPTQEKTIKDDSIKDDVGVTKVFNAQWQVKQEEGDEEASMAASRGP